MEDITSKSTFSELLKLQTLCPYMSLCSLCNNSDLILETVSNRNFRMCHKKGWCWCCWNTCRRSSK